jgi:hypothetical protein
MRVTIKRVKKNDFIAKVLSLYAIVSEVAPEDGVIIEREYSPSLYLSWRDLEKFWESGADSIELTF